MLVEINNIGYYVDVYVRSIWFQKKYDVGNLKYRLKLNKGILKSF